MKVLTPPSTGRLIDPSLFTDVDGALHLAGSTCDDCSTVTFPAQRSCPRCAGLRVRVTALASTGTLWAFTVQGFPPKPPYLGAQSPFRPYGVGYVDLGGVLVESRLTTADVSTMYVGMPVELELELVPGREDDPVWCFSFAPANEGNAAYD